MQHVHHSDESNAPDDPLPFADASVLDPFEDLAFQHAVRQEDEGDGNDDDGRRLPSEINGVDGRTRAVSYLGHTDESGRYEVEEGEEEETRRSNERKTRVIPYFGHVQTDVSDDLELTPLLRDAEGDDRGPSSSRHEEPVDVTLLQSTLRSSQFQRHTRSWFPLSGHWAVEIRGEVFELNRTVAWKEFRVGSGRSPLRIDASINYILKLFFLSYAGAETQIDCSDHDDYVGRRGEHTITRSRLGTTVMPQSELKEAVAVRNERPRLYTIYSNNCQHFILDLCEYMDLQFETSNLHVLWLKSRLTFLGCCLLELGISISLPHTTTWLVWNSETEYKEHVRRVHPALALAVFILVIGVCYCLLVAPMFVGESKLAVTVSGARYMYGSCYTGSTMRSTLRKASPCHKQILYRILLQLEKFPYPAFAIVGLGFAICHALLQLSDRNYYFVELDSASVYLMVFVPEVLAYVVMILFIGTPLFSQWRMIKESADVGRIGSV